MVGLFGTLGTANKGLNVQQKALETAGHNIANANTVGYSRQRVNMAADNPYRIAGIGQVGTGVKITSISRIVDDFVIGNMRQETSSYNQFEQKSDILGQLEVIFNETPLHKGLSSNLATYFDSWSKLGSNPEMDNAKSIVLENGNILTDAINHMAKQIDELNDNTVSILEKGTLDFNGKLQQLDTINRQIYKISNDGSIPNDLLDQRDILLEDLSSFAKLETSFDKYGRVSIKLDKQDVLTNNEIKTVSVVVGKDKDGKTLVSRGGDSLNNREVLDESYEVGQILISDSKKNNDPFTPVEMTSGISKGIQDSLVEVKARMKELNNFVFNLAKAVNTIHSDQGKSIDFFSLGDDSNYALNLKVNSDIKKDPSLINTGKDLAGHEVGDGSRATAISKLKDTRLKYPTDFKTYNPDSMSFENEDGGLTFLGSFIDIVTKNGISKQQADNKVTSQEYLLSQLQQRKDSISGVNVNEEVTDVIRFQRAFQANSKVISVVSEMLDTLINRTGV
ncbi:flagellar hook-associated protein FlgK [Vagococcus fluvialis]|uniref:flagellar hook-associated protein FlgK n=1 Tax=Vagococcus fluvialis TaxID=2738 RepID=UPI001A8E6DBD|nr:flagellar hook-associated protein FlgK [Vagococcus fluvialis]MBO0436792.1 flagellar hook-associated protein FlgK [Vagococcus fluvialis]